MSDTVTIMLDREEAKAHVGVGPITPETPCPCGATAPAHYCPLDAAARQKIRAALDSPAPEQSQVPSAPLGDEERERLRKIASGLERHQENAEASGAIGTGSAIRYASEVAFLRKLAEQPSSESDYLRKINKQLAAFLRERRSRFEERPSWGNCLTAIDEFFAALTEKASGDQEGDGRG